MGVPTMPGVKGKGITEDAYRHLQLVYPFTITAQDVASATGHNLNTVRGALQRLVGRGLAVRVNIGLYQATMSPFTQTFVVELK